MFVGVFYPGISFQYKKGKKKKKRKRSDRLFCYLPNNTYLCKQSSLKGLTGFDSKRCGM